MVRNNKSLFLTIALVLCLTATVFVFSPQVSAATDTPSAQEGADKPTSPAVSEKLSTCIGDGYGSLGMTSQYQNCVVLQCRGLGTLQYRDRCLKDGFNLNGCNYIADITKTEGEYLACVKLMADKCNALGTSAVDGSTPKDRCFEAAAWYVSRYSNSADDTYGTVGHGTAYLEYLPLLKGDLTLAQAVDFIREIRGQAPLDSSSEEEVDDAAGADNEDAQGSDPTATGSIENGLDCTVNGQPGVKTSIPIVGSEACVPKGDTLESNPIIALMRLVLQVATAGVGLVVAIMIIVAGIQYTSAQGNPQLIQAAKQRLMNAVIGLIMYIFAFALLNYLVPGNLIG